jgi:hypothetical protein
MAITNYSELKTAVVDWADRADISTARIEDFIYLAEADASQLLRVPAMEHQELLVVADGRVTIPFDYLELRRLTWQGDTEKVLQYMSWDNFVDVNNDVNDPNNVLYFSRQGPSWWLAKDVGDGEEILCHYYRFVPALTDTDDTNWLLSISPQAYLFGALRYLYEFTMDNERAAYWDAKFKAELGKLQGIADQAEYRGSTIVVRPVN